MSELIQQRIYVETRRKLDSLSRLEGRTNPKQLKVIVDEAFARHPELTASEPRADEAGKVGKSE